MAHIHLPPGYLILIHHANREKPNKHEKECFKHVTMLPLLSLPVSGNTAQNHDLQKDDAAMERAKKEYTFKWAQESIKQDYYIAGTLPPDDDWTSRIRKALAYFSILLQVYDVEKYDAGDDEDLTKEVMSETEYLGEDGFVLGRYVMALRNSNVTQVLTFLPEDTEKAFHMSNSQIVEAYEKYSEPRKKARLEQPPLEKQPKPKTAKEKMEMISRAEK